MLLTCETMLKDVPNLMGTCVAHLFQYLAAAPDLLGFWSWLPRGQCFSLEEWFKTPLAWSGIWTSRNVRQTASVL